TSSRYRSHPKATAPPRPLSPAAVHLPTADESRPPPVGSVRKFPSPGASYEPVPAACLGPEPSHAGSRTYSGERREASDSGTRGTRVGSTARANATATPAPDTALARTAAASAPAPVPVGTGSAASSTA